MTIPDYQTIMLPLLELASDKNEHSMREAIEVLADQFSLSEQERNDLLPSGRQARFDHRVGSQEFVRMIGDHFPKKQ